ICRRQEGAGTGLIPLFPLFKDQPDAVPYLGQAHADIRDGKGSNNILGHRYRRLLAFRTAIEVEVLDGLRAFFLDRLLASYRSFRLLRYRQGRGVRPFLLLSSERDGGVGVATRWRGRDGGGCLGGLADDGKDRRVHPADPLVAMVVA